MEDNPIFEVSPVQAAPRFYFDSPKEKSSYIKVIGVGGGGGNAVNHMFNEGIEGVDFIVCNTDMKALNLSPVPAQNKIPLGKLGLGAGSKPEKARKAAEDMEDEIREALSHNTQMLFITAGMGGGTGTGAAPVIARIAKSIELPDEENKHILVVAIVTRPFSFEGEKRCAQAEAGIEQLRKEVDSIIIINNDNLRTVGNLPMSKAFALADDVLLTAVKGIAEIITKEAYVNRDFQDVNTVMEHSGTALMGTGSGKGENRAHDAIVAATTSFLLDNSDISGAKNVLLYFTFSHEHEMTIDEQTLITNFVGEITGNTAEEVLWGAGFDDELDDELKVILIATGFEKATDKKEVENVITMHPDAPEEPKPQPKAEVEDANEPTLKHIEPEEQKAEPVAVVEPVQEPAKPAKVIIPLNDEPVVHEEFKTEIDTMVDESEIHLVHKEEPVAEQPKEQPRFDAPKPAPQPQKIERPVTSAFENDNDALTAAERIAKIHEMLRNDANGPDKVQRMTIQQIAGNVVFADSFSGAREASGFTIGQNGKMTSNPTLYEEVD